MTDEEAFQRLMNILKELAIAVESATLLAEIIFLEQEVLDR